MAFNTNAGTVTTTVVSKDDSWKAQGFINIYLPSPNGSKRKLGAIPLKASDKNEKLLLEWLNADPERVQLLLKSMIVEYRSAETPEGSGFVLPE